MKLSFAMVLLMFILSSVPARAEFFFRSDTSSLPCLTAAGKQLDEAFLLMEKHYYRKQEMNWDSLKTAAREKLYRVSDCDEAMQTINWCFRQIGEPHSFVMPAIRADLYNNNQVHLKTKPSLFQMMGEIKSVFYEDKGIGYLTIPWVNTTDSAICTIIADSIQQEIAKLDKKGVSKWIIDLRNNRGGNCWPMIAGLGPLLGNGVCGYFVSGDEKVPISYSQGAAMHGRYTRCKVSQPPYQVTSTRKSIIVLTGPRTSSSGEILALAFKGKDQTYLYGQPTAGMTTANTIYILSDRSMLVLTVCREADRNGKLVEGKILPDELFPDCTGPEDEDLAMNAAVMWLHIQ